MTDSILKTMISEEAEKEILTGNEQVKFAMDEFMEWEKKWEEANPDEAKSTLELVEIYLKEKSCQNIQKKNSTP